MWLLFNEIIRSEKICINLAPCNSGNSSFCYCSDLDTQAGIYFLLLTSQFFLTYIIWRYISIYMDTVTIAAHFWDNVLHPYIKSLRITIKAKHWNKNLSQRQDAGFLEVENWLGMALHPWFLLLVWGKNTIYADR